MRKSKYLFIALMMGSLSVFGQNEADSVLDQEAIRSKVMTEAYSYIDSCAVPKVSKVDVVLFKDYANIFVDMKGGLGKESQFNIISKDGRFKQTVAKSSSFYLVHLPLNQQFQVLSSNSCGESVVLANFNSIVGDLRNENGLEVSAELFNKLADYFSHPGAKITAYEDLINAPNVTYYEKLAFIQGFYAKGEPFSIDKDKISPVFDNPPVFTTDRVFYFDPNIIKAWLDRLKVACNCELTVRSDVGMFDDGYKISNGTMYPSYETRKDEESKKYDAWKAYSRIGAARYEQAWQQGKNSDGKTYQPSGVGGENDKAPYYSRIWYNWICSNKSGHPSTQCACKKDIHVRYYYHSDLMTTLDNFPRGIQSKGATAHVEDWAIMTKIDDQGNVEILDADNAALEQKHNASLSGKFLKDFAKVAGEIANEMADNDSVATSLPDIAEDIGELAGDTAVIQNGEDGEKNMIGAQLDGTKTISLETNHPIRLQLYSIGAIKLTGYTTWHATARVTSSASLAGYIFCGIPDGENDFCNTPGNAAWLLGSVLDNGFWAGLRNDLNSFYTINGYNGFPNTDHGINKVYCGSQNRPANPIEAVDRKLSVYRYEIYSMDGRRLKSGMTDKNDVNALNKQLDAVPGIYLFRLVDENQQETITKAYHNN